MEILNYKKTEIQNSYVDFKASMDAVVERVEEGFVQIGYYLKIARDTHVLHALHSSRPAPSDAGSCLFFLLWRCKACGHPEARR